MDPNVVVKREKKRSSEISKPPISSSVEQKDLGKDAWKESARESARDYKAARIEEKDGWKEAGRDAGRDYKSSRADDYVENSGKSSRNASSSGKGIWRWSIMISLSA